MITADEALQRILAQATALAKEEERIAVAAAEGRVVAEAVHSPQHLPPFDNAAMDGFALRLDGVAAAPGQQFLLEGWLAAGDGAADATHGAWEIMTGARLPTGLDSVVPVEQVAVVEMVDGRPARVELRAAVVPGQHVRCRGQDVAQGDLLLEAGTRVDTNAVALLHAVGAAEVTVRRRPRVAVIATGKELVTDAGQRLDSGQIRDSNRPYLVARMRSAGAEVVWQDTVSDEVAQFERALDAALAAGARVIVSTGAVSAGRYDFIPDALRARHADIVFHKVAIRPGKPLLFARLACGALYFGLPGNPVSTAVGQRFFVEPALRVLLGLPAERVPEVPLATPVRAPAGLRWHVRARVGVDTSGRLRATVLTGQESFRLATTMRANAWAVIEPAPDGADVACGRVWGWSHLEPIDLQNEEATWLS